jgi:uncharacterized protein with FMN-binding domain
MKKGLKIVLIIIIVMVLTAAGGIYYLTRGMEDVNDMSLNGINLTRISDGAYYGSCESGRWTNTLEIHVEGGRISKINVSKDVRFVQEGVSNDLFAKVISAQDTRVDTVSGATITSKAYLKSIENAFVP